MATRHGARTRRRRRSPARPANAITDVDKPDAQSMLVYYAARVSDYDRIYQKPERQADIARLRNQLLDRTFRL